MKAEQIADCCGAITLKGFYMNGSDCILYSTPDDWAERVAKFLKDKKQNTTVDWIFAILNDQELNGLKTNVWNTNSGKPNQFPALRPIFLEAGFIPLTGIKNNNSANRIELWIYIRRPSNLQSIDKQVYDLIQENLKGPVKKTRAKK